MIKHLVQASEMVSLFASIIRKRNQNAAPEQRNEAFATFR